MTFSRIATHLITLAAALVLAGCGGNSSNDTVPPADGKIQYAPTKELVPSPNDLAFQESSDGTLEAAGRDDLNALDGFSTIGSIKVSSSVPIKRTSVEPGSNIRVFSVDTVGDPGSGSLVPEQTVTGIKTELTPGTDYTASVSAADRNNRSIAITPLQPLSANETFLVIVTDGVEEAGGSGPLSASEQYQLVKGSDPLFDGSNSTVDSLNDSDAEALEGIRQLVAGGGDVNSDGNSDGHIPTIERETALSGENVIVSWTFSTQRIGQTVDRVRTDIRDNASPAFVDSTTDPVTSNQLSFVPDAALPVDIPDGDIFAGVLSGVRYYLEPGSGDPSNVVNGTWSPSGGGISTPGETPEVNASLDVPVLVALPSNDSGSASDVVVFQHGIRSNRTAMLGIANALTSQGLAVVAIDLPLHGITDPDNGLYAESNERTFNVDLVDNEDGASGGDGQIDPSGEHFINLPNLLTSRDNLRQSAADLFTVVLAIQGAASNSVSIDSGQEDSDADFTSNIRFLGHSLGGIVGIPFLATEPGVDAAALGMAGGGIAKLLDGSPTIGPRIQAGLELQGLTKATPAYEQFLTVAQTVVDSGDALNYAQRAASGGTAEPSGNTIPNRNVLGLEVVGGSASPPDQVVPNNVVKPYQEGVPDGTVPSPTAGTDPLVSTLNLSQVDTSGSPAPDGQDLIRYVAGGHASLLDPSTDAAATAEMQTNVASFLASNGSVLNFVDNGTIESVD